MIHGGSATGQIGRNRRNSSQIIGSGQAEDAPCMRAPCLRCLSCRRGWSISICSSRWSSGPESNYPPLSFVLRPNW